MGYTRCIHTERSVPALRQSDFPDFPHLLHELRTRQLKDLTYEGPTVLSAGCGGTWYFDWFRSCYSGQLKTHLGIEAFNPRPDDLPLEARWIADQVYDMNSVRSGAVDLVFAGHTVEHLWPPEFAGFLSEAHRVLRPKGRILLDSPNRNITLPLNWSMREHTVEYTISEIRQLLDLAGFDTVSLLGMWQCRRNGALLPLFPAVDTEEFEARLHNAALEPEDSFAWWLEAIRSERPPKREELLEAIQQIYKRARPAHLQATLRHTIGCYSRSETGERVTAASGESGYLHHGPYLPFPRGLHQVGIALSSSSPDKSDDVACVLDATDDYAQTVITTCNVRCSDLDTAPRTWYLNLRFGRTRFGVEYRVFTSGRIPVCLHLPLQVLTVESDKVVANGSGPCPVEDMLMKGVC
jgi:SAM-dependent methyltransferase